MNIERLRDKFTEIIGSHLHDKDVQKGLVHSNSGAIRDWFHRYQGFMDTNSPQDYLAINLFRNEVNVIVGMLMQAVSETEKESEVMQ
jgi:hypothetical protein